MARRLQAMGQPNYAKGFQLALHEEMIELPLRWKKPQMVFVNSMSDLFHDKAPDAFILRIFSVMNRATWHRFQILTKRSARLLKMNSVLPWSPNIWMGVTVENQKCTVRLDHLRKTSANIKFLSIEPLLGPVSNLDLSGIDWVILGGESGPGARPMEKEWVVEIRDACVKNDVPFFFKQWGGVNKKLAGRRLEGRIWSQMPDAPAPNQPLELAFA
jgi:protein gp37